MRNLTELSGESEIRSFSVQELDLISGGTKVSFGGGISWNVHTDGSVTLRYPDGHGGTTGVIIPE